LPSIGRLRRPESGQKAARVATKFGPKHRARYSDGQPRTKLQCKVAALPLSPQTGPLSVCFGLSERRASLRRASLWGRTNSPNEQTRQTSAICTIVCCLILDFSSGASKWILGQKVGTEEGCSFGLRGRANCLHAKRNAVKNISALIWPLGSCSLARFLLLATVSGNTFTPLSCLYTLLLEHSNGARNKVLAWAEVAGELEPKVEEAPQWLVLDGRRDSN